MYAECVFIIYQYLRDQTDMLVVGVIGLQGTGKSTIMSLLSANSPEEDQRLVRHQHPDFVFVSIHLFAFPPNCSCISPNHSLLNRAYVFRAQTQEIKERAGNQSSGIDLYITQERVIFLDTQVRLKGRTEQCCFHVVS